MDIGKVLKNYIFWTYDRGSVHYDLMVTLILAFIFITPHYVNFKDKPAAHATHPNQIIISPDGQNGFVYEISANQVAPGSDIKEELMRALEPVVGNVTITRYQTLRDAKGKIIAYRAWGARP